MTRGLAILVADLIMAAWGLSLAPHWQTQSVLWLVGGALALELAAVRLPGFGFFSLATPYYLAMQIHPEVGFLPALLVASLAILVRGLLVGLPTWQGRCREALAQLTPLLASGVALQLLAPHLQPPLLVWLLAAQIHFTLAWQVTRMLAAESVTGPLLQDWLELQAALTPLLFCLAYLGVLLAANPGSTAWGLLALPCLLGLRQALSLVMVATRARQEEKLRRHLATAEQDLASVRQDRERTQQELRLKIDQVVLLEDLARSLAQNPDPLSTMDRILQMARGLAGCQTLAIFCPEEGRLVPVRFGGPQAERLASARLLGRGEPVVEQAWRQGEAVSARSGAWLQGEWALALPLGALGVLYLGDPDRQGFSADELQQLRSLAAQATVSLQCAHYFQQQQQLLADYALAHQRLSAWSQGLDLVLEGARAMASAVDPASLEEALRAILPCDRLWLALEPADGELSEIVRVVCQSGKPLLFEDIRTTRFAPPAGMVSLLAAPLCGRQGALGAILVGSAATGQYTRLHQDLLCLLALQAAASLEAYRQLQDYEAQLVQAGKLAAVGQLAAGVAHELNTPLAAISLGLEMALNNLEKHPERVRPRLETASQSVAQAQEVVSGLLYYAREGRLQQSFELHKLVADTLALLDFPLRSDEVELVRQVAPLPPITGVPGEIQQVIINLVLNARDAVLETGARARRVTLTTRSEPGLVVLDVADQGPGIPPDVQSRVFDPFFTTKPVGKGTGLGLSLSQQIVARHQGTLVVASSGELGTCMRMSLPA